VLYNFLEQYLLRLEGPLAHQVWGRFLQLVKDVIAARDFKVQTFLTLRSDSFSIIGEAESDMIARCLSVLAEKITQTAAIDDRRIRKELQVQ
jgi:hypothetical protein